MQGGGCLVDEQVPGFIVEEIQNLNLKRSITFSAVPQTATPPVTSLAFRSDGKMLAIGNGAGQIHLVNPADGKVLRATQAQHTSSVTGLAFHPGLGVLGSCSKDRTVKLWDVNSGAQLVNLDGHTAWVQGVVFLEKGTRIATVGADQTVRVWDLTPKK